MKTMFVRQITSVHAIQKCQAYYTANQPLVSAIGMFSPTTTIMPLDTGARETLPHCLSPSRD